MKIFNLPDLGEGLPDAEIREWHVKEGDVVEVDQVLVSMETAKAVVEVPSPQKGTIQKLYGKAGDVIITGKPLVEYVEGEEVKRPDSGTVAGKITVGDTVLNESPTGIQPRQDSSSAVKAMPAVRMLAKKLGVDLAEVKATGPRGQITLQDVENHGGGAKANVQPSIPDAEPLRGVRRAMADVMAKAQAEVVLVTLMDDASIAGWAEGNDITIRIIRSLTVACKAESSLNAWYDGKAVARKCFSEVNVGLALDSAEGLFVPVIKHAEQKSAAELRQEINSFKEMAKKREFPPEVLKGATISVSNFGVFAGKYATPIVVPPTVAIVAIGKLQNKVLPLSVSFDHRAVTGGEAARFLAAMIYDLQQPQ